jgi:predicted MFS family arabinose efflux permease
VYGIFNTAFGITWFLGSTLMGALYDVSVVSLVLFSVAMQVVAAILLATLNTKT